MKKRIVVAVVLAILMAASAYAQTANFFELVKTGTPQSVQAAISGGADVNAQDMKDEYGKTPLMWAARNNTNPEVITTLLKAGAKIEARDTRGYTPLKYAAWNNPNLEVVTTLLKAGADINARDKVDWTPLMFAASNNKTLR